MEIKLDVYITDSEINIKFDDNKSIVRILDINDFTFDEQSLYFLLNNDNVEYIGQIKDNYSKKINNFDKVIAISVPSEVDLKYLENILVKEALQKGITLINKEDLIEINLSEKQSDHINEYKNKILFILKNFGYVLFELKNNDKSVNKSRPEKARHKWSKEISQIKFTAKLRGGEGEVIWQSKDKLVLLSGAKLVENAQLNKDGTVNYSAQFAQKLRSDNSDKISNNVTTEDIIFPSPNQLGIFLFFGGQNTWSELKDSNGKTLDEWSRVD
ncbi:MAG: hypothetical protein N2749_06315 [Clostridia bacterium]|nr:hypothetical protein [Clostridia bacterium]